MFGCWGHRWGLSSSLAVWAVTAAETSGWPPPPWAGSLGGWALQPGGGGHMTPEGAASSPAPPRLTPPFSSASS